MARYTGPKNKLSRREGYNLFGSTSRSLERRINTPPGARATSRRRKVSEYAVQLREKQKVKRIYGVLEKQFLRFFNEANRQRGQTGEALLQLLERRLDNTVYRLALARTRPMARQMVTHGHVKVNGHRVNIPSYIVKPGEVIELDAKAREIPAVHEAMQERPVTPGWLTRQETTGRIVRLPYREEMEPGVHEELIVEFYSR